MTTITVTNTELRPDNTPKRAGRVTVGIVGVGWQGDGSLITDKTHELTDADGLASFDLAPSPAGTWYVWTHSDGKSQSTFVVPSSGGPFTLQSLLVAQTTDAPDLALTHDALAAELANYVAQTEVGSASGVAALDGSSKVPIAQIPTGTSSSTVAAGNDSRITGAAQKSANLSDVASPATALANLGGVDKPTTQGIALVNALILGG